MSISGSAGAEGHAHFGGAAGSRFFCAAFDMMLYTILYVGNQYYKVVYKGVLGGGSIKKWYRNEIAYVPLLIRTGIHLIPLGMAFLARRSLKAAGICLTILGAIETLLVSGVFLSRSAGELVAPVMVSLAVSAVLILFTGILCLVTNRKSKGANV